MIVIKRKEVENLKDKRWYLIFGRRKTGKTFIIKEFLKVKNYFYVGRERKIFYNSEEISYEDLKKKILELKEGICIDEFQRLPEDFLDFLAANKEKINLFGRIFFKYLK